MPTTPGRPHFTPSAVRCFLEQTWSNKELVVVIDGDMPSMREFEFRHEFMDMWPGTQFVSEWIKPGISLGAKRNRCCELANGEFIFHWDDDDWSAPGRIASQMALLRSEGPAKVTGMRSMLFADYTDGGVWRYTGASNANLGTSLAYRRSWWERHPFQDIAKAEDSRFINEAVRRGTYAGTMDFGLMVARSHKANTDKRYYVGSEWTRADVDQLPESFRAGFHSAVAV